MKGRAAVLVLMLLPVLRAAAIEPADLRGLDLLFEEIPEPIRMEGVAAHVEHARGRDVLRAVERTERRWRAQVHPVQHLQVGGWTLLARLRDGQSEVLQWRGEGADAQLLFSRIDLKARLRQPPASPFVLPAPCSWGPVVSGKAAASEYQQRSARCRATVAASVAVLRAALSSQGWQVSGSDAQLLVERNRLRASLLVVPGISRGESWLVWTDELRQEGSTP